jgi:hypothetical protein
MILRRRSGTSLEVTGGRKYPYTGCTLTDENTIALRRVRESFFIGFVGKGRQFSLRQGYFSSKK